MTNEEKELSQIHKNYDGKFDYHGTSFIIDHIPNKDTWHNAEWIVTEQCFLTGGQGDTLEDAIENAKQRWDEFKGFNYEPKEL